MKSDKNIVRDILKAQGLPYDTEPTDEAVKVLIAYGTARWREGNDDATYDFNSNWP